ncbi:MAG: aminoacyl-tRNA hydrolase [Anaerolineae bacterium]|nr:aminoacyl-tRNA hydrolase [Anaerolineae bacterium]
MTDWYLIVGLGNPGKDYEETRHNVGFRVVDELARRYGLSFGKTERKSQAASGVIKSKKVILAKPQTYMNLSGEAVRSLADFYKVEVPNILIIADDLDIPLGTVRLRQSGSAGGQNGIKSVIQHLGTQEINRLRFGIGRPPGKMQAKDYVLGVFKSDDAILASQVVDRASDAAETWLTDGIELAMTRHNGNIDDPKPVPKKAPAEKRKQVELEPDFDSLKNHLDIDGKLKWWPSKRSKQLLALDYLTTKFEPGKVYSEQEVNDLLNQWHTFGDPALLRRELFDDALLNRQQDGTEYWYTPATKMY